MGVTTGVSLEQGLGLTDISRRGCPGRRPSGDERGSPPDYYLPFIKLIRAPSEFDSPVLVPSWGGPGRGAPKSAFAGQVAALHSACEFGLRAWGLPVQRVPPGRRTPFKLLD